MIRQVYDIFCDELLFVSIESGGLARSGRGGEARGVLAVVERRVVVGAGRGPVPLVRPGRDACDAT